MKILFIGIITEDVLAQTKMDKFVDICEAAEEIGRICNTYNPIDIDFTIILTHIGFEEDKSWQQCLIPLGVLTLLSAVIRIPFGASCKG